MKNEEKFDYHDLVDDIFEITEKVIKDKAPEGLEMRYIKQLQKDFSRKVNSYKKIRETKLDVRLKGVATNLSKKMRLKDYPYTYEDDMGNLRLTKSMPHTIAKWIINDILIKGENDKAPERALKEFPIAKEHFNVLFTASVYEVDNILPNENDESYGVLNQLIESYKFDRDVVKAKSSFRAVITYIVGGLEQMAEENWKEVAIKVCHESLISTLKLTNDRSIKIIMVKTLVATGMTQAEISRQSGIPISTIFDLTKVRV